MADAGRARRLAGRIKQIVATGIETQIKDPRLGMVTITDVRGHAPRDAGAKMVVAADGAWGSVGGGNLEETALARARAMIDEATTAPEQLVLGLTDKARTDHGRQCCGGEVTLLLEPLPVVVFGIET